MTITLNGQVVELNDTGDHSLQELLRSHGLQPDRVAIERNGEILPRRSWPEVVLSPGDRLEVVHFVGGGSCVIERSSSSHRSP